MLAVGITKLEDLAANCPPRVPKSSYFTGGKKMSNPFMIQGKTAYLYFEAGNRNTSTYLATWMETPFE